MIQTVEKIVLMWLGLSLSGQIAAVMAMPALLGVAWVWFKYINPLRLRVVSPQSITKETVAVWTQGEIQAVMAVLTQASRGGDEATMELMHRGSNAWVCEERRLYMKKKYCAQDPGEIVEYLLAKREDLIKEDLTGYPAMTLDLTFVNYMNSSAQGGLLRFVQRVLELNQMALTIIYAADAPKILEDFYLHLRTIGGEGENIVVRSENRVAQLPVM